MSLFSGAALNIKLTTAMYTNTKVNRQTIKLILDSGLADSIITQQFMDQLILIDNDWLVKTNAVLDWNMQKLQLSQNKQHIRMPVMCDHFKLNSTILAPLIKFEEKKNPYLEGLSSFII
ncbi:hypothetical protein G9A89_015772 [Geosiphon pyriformis]|nr:hypothetical protein G9A89_015772 [Geosiphon pyriformis]